MPEMNNETLGILLQIAAVCGIWDIGNNLRNVIKLLCAINSRLADAQR